MTGTAVSVLIPAYNRAGTLPRVLESIFEQTHGPAEVIVVDDGSTDGTSEVLESLRRARPDWGERLVVIRQANAGKSAALNRALARASGDWIAYDDADDVWVPDKLRLQLDALGRHEGCGACVTDTAFGSAAPGGKTTFELGGIALDGDEGLLPDAPLITARASHGIMMQTLLIEASLARRVGEFDPRLRAGQDIDYLFRVALETPICFLRQALVVLDRTGDEGRLTRQFPMGSAARLELHELMVERWRAELPPGDARLLAAVRRRLLATRSSLANRLILDGRPAEARSVLRRALAQDFAWPLAAKLVLVRIAPAPARWWLGRRGGRQS